MFGGVLYMTPAQALDVFGFNIYPMRVLTLAAFVRVVARGEWSLSMFNDIDGALLLAYGYRTAVFILNGNGAASEQIGVLVDVILSYFAFRGLVGSFGDLVWLLRALVALLVPYVALLLIESTTWDNPFGVIGGVVVHEFRGARPRCFGSFVHPVLLGTFGASFLPLFFALVVLNKSRCLSIVGITLCLAMVFVANSGAPVTCSAVAIVGWILWFVRRKMFTVRLSILVVLILFGTAMKDPIWYLPAKVSDVTGGGGWHRSYLMDVAFRNLDKWWLAGMSVLKTKDWFPYLIMTGGADITNYYLDFGISAGIIAMVLFIRLLFLCFSRLGRALEKSRAVVNPAVDSREKLLWACGVMLTIHVINWFSILYFDQFYAVLFMQLAVISTLSHQTIVAPLPCVGLVTKKSVVRRR